MTLKLSPVLFFALSVGLPSAPIQAQTVPPGTCTIFVLPDTQYYASRYPSIFNDQINWIVNNWATSNGAYVLHEGDITDTNTNAEWQVATAATGILDANHIPYAVVPGNHDYGYNGPPGSVNFNQYYNPARFGPGGSTPMPTFDSVKDPGKMDNNVHKFGACGIKWMIVGVEYGPTVATAAWMNAVISANPDYRVIILTHNYMYNDRSRAGSKPEHTWQPGAPNLNGEQLWNEVVRKHINVQFVISGHIVPGCGGTCPPAIQWGGQDASTLVSRGDSGNLVYQMFVNFQEQEMGGNGFLRMLTLDPAAHTVTAQTFSPTVNQFKRSSENEFVLQNVDLSPAQPTTRVTPFAAATFNTTQIAGQPYVFTSTSQHLQSGNNLNFKWSFSDGQTLSGETVTHTFLPTSTKKNSFTPNGTVTLTVTAPRGVSSTYTGQISVRDPLNTLIVDDFRTGISRWEAFTEIPGGFTQWNSSPNTDALTLYGASWGGDYYSNGLNKPSTYILAKNDSFPLYNINGDYNFKAQIRSNSWNSVGMVVRYQGPGDHYKISMNLNFGFFTITKFQGGISSTLVIRGNWTYVPGQTYAMEVRCLGNTITVLLDNVVYLTAQDTNAPILTGRVGFYDWISASVIKNAELTRP